MLFTRFKATTLSLFICVICVNISAHEKYPLQKQTKELRSNFRSLVHKGNKFFEETSFYEALNAYENARKLKEKQEPSLIYRIAYLHFLLGNQNQSIDLLNEIEDIRKVPEVYYLKGRILTAQGEFNHAISQYNTYLAKSKIENEKSALYELSLLHKETGNISKAKYYLFKLKDNAAESSWQVLAISSLIELMLLENKFEDAASLSKVLAEQTDSSAAYFSQGIVAFFTQNFKEASLSFKKASKTTNNNLKPLKISSLQYLVHSNGFLLQDNSLSSFERNTLLTQMEEALKLLSSVASEHEKNYPLIHYLYAKSSEESKETAKKLLQRSSKKDIRHLYFSAMLLNEPIDDDSIPLTYLSQIIYYQGLENLHVSNSDFAYGCFLKSLGSSDKLQSTSQANIIKGLACSALLTNKPAPIDETYNVTRKFISEKSFDISPFLEAELLYLHGLICKRIGERKPHLAFNLEAKQAFIDSALKARGMPVADEALFALGTLSLEQNQFTEAKRAFLALQDSERKGAESLYHAASCAERLGEDTRPIKEVLIKNFPKTEFAAECYLTYFPYSSYISGEPLAIQHLVAMPTRMPKSKWLIPAYFLTGVSYREGHSKARIRQMQKALHAFQKVEQIFEESNFSDEEVPYFSAYRFYAALEKARSAVTLSHVSPEAKKQFFLTYAKGALEEISLELAEGESPSARSLKKQQPYPKVQEQAEFELAKVLFMQKKDAAAVSVLDSMIENYKSLRITRAEYLASAFFEKAKYQYDSSLYDESLKILELADEASTGTSAPLLRLKIWLLASECYTEKKEYREAMKYLSRVINEDIVSSLRLKAMYKRGELYNLQDKHELALKQFESLAKFKGHWPDKAKEELQ